MVEGEDGATTLDGQFGMVAGRVTGIRRARSGSGLSVDLSVDRGTTRRPALATVRADGLARAIRRALLGMEPGERVGLMGEWEAAPAGGRDARRMRVLSFDSARVGLAAAGDDVGPEGLAGGADAAFARSWAARRRQVVRVESEMKDYFAADVAKGEPRELAFAHAVREFGEHHPGVPRAVVAPAVRMLARDLAMDAADARVSSVIPDDDAFVSGGVAAPARIPARRRALVREGEDATPSL